MMRFLTGPEEIGKYSHYSIIPSFYHYYSGERTKLNFLPFSCLSPTQDGGEVGVEGGKVVLLVLVLFLGLWVPKSY